MTRRSSRSRRRTKSGGGPTAAGVAVLLLLGGTAAVLAWNADPGGANGTPGVEEARTDDIFADVPDDVPPVREHRSVTPLGGKATPLPTDERAWNEATAFAERAEVALKEALAAQEAGARDLAKRKGGEAQELYSRALEAANPWLESLAASLGRNDPLVARIDRTTRGWARELVFLKKSAGL